jgi:hypothetical protein
LLLPVSPARAKLRSGVSPSGPTVKTFPFRPSSPLDGIISHLTAKFGGNIHDRGVVRTTENRVLKDNSSHAAKNVVDLGTDSHFLSVSDAKDSRCFDFTKMAFKPTPCSIRTNCNGLNGNHLKSWVLEGSKDGNLWIEIDRQDGCGDLNSRFAVVTFQLVALNQFACFDFSRPDQITADTIVCTSQHLKSLDPRLELGEVNPNGSFAGQK